MSGQLNERQALVVQTTDNHCSVVSCPGSGKTKTVISKILHLIKLYPDANIGAITFSKKSANEMQERLEKEVRNKADLKKVHVRTFNALGARMINAKFKRERKKVKLVTNWEKNSFCKNYLKDHPDLEGEIDAKEILAIAEKVKRMEGQAALSPLEASVFSAYQEMLAEKGAIDFTDQILLARDGMQDGSIPPPPFDFLMIDEFQDTDPLQISFLEAFLAKKQCIITAVGDEDQSIYGFRGALGFDAIKWVESLPGARRIVMDTNYRSHAEILNPADKLIKKNKERIPKNLDPFKGKGGQVDWMLLLDSEAALNYVTNDIIKRVSNGKNEVGDFAIIARTNIELTPYIFDLLAKGVPVSSGMEDLSESFEFRFACELLRSFEGLDDAGLTYLLHIGQIQDRTINYLTKTNGMELLSIAHDVPEDEIKYPSGMVSNDIKKFKLCFDVFRQLSNLYHEENYVLLMHAVEDFLVDFSGDSHYYSKDSLKGVARFIEQILSAEGSLSKRIRTVEYILKERAKCNYGVSVITAHSSKGLEFKKVYLIGANQEVFPLISARDKEAFDSDYTLLDKHLSEERRLFYVAMTRAMNEMTVISYKQKTPTSKEQEGAGKGGEKKKSSSKKNPIALEISQFIQEAGLV